MQHITRLTNNCCSLLAIFDQLAHGSVNHGAGGNIDCLDRDLGLNTACRTDGGQFYNKEYSMEGIYSSSD